MTTTLSRATGEPAIADDGRRPAIAGDGGSAAARPPRRLNATPLLFLAPALLLVALLTLLPALVALWVSLHQTSFLELRGFVGLANYARLLADPAVQRAAVNSVLYVGGSLALMLPLSVGLALLLHQRLPGIAVFRTALILPWVVSQVVTALTAAWLLNVRFGPVAWLGREYLGGALNLLGDPRWALLTLILVNVWKSYGLPMIFTLAALQTVPEELHEAARVDGANAWTRFWRITLPLIQPVLLVALIIESLTCFNMMALPYTLTGGGPAGATSLLALRVYEDGVVNQRLDLACALSVLMVVLNLIFSLLYIRVLRREVHW